MHDHADQPKLVEFDADFSPDHEVNRRAAAARRVRFDPRSGYYKDEDGCARLDRFGQPL
jgi:hypothetical protein